MANRQPGRLATFSSDVSGATALLFAGVSMLLVISTGVAIDLSSAHAEQAAMQSAADASALAAARVNSANPSAQILRGNSFFKANFPQHASVSLSVTVDAGVINVDATKDYGTKLLPIVGIDSVAISVHSQVPVAATGQAEIVLVLDYSDSMLDNDKYLRLKDAANQMVDAISANGTNPNVKFSIVPFAALVHADLPPSFIRSDVTYDGCTQDRRYPSNTQEASGYNDDSRWGEITSTHDCEDMDDAGLKVIPLTSDIDLVKSKIDDMEPYLWTHIALGAEFGQQALSPSGPFANASAYGNPSMLKVFVLLTDGMQTAPGWGPGSTQSAADGETNLLAICAAMKLQNISVYTVGYDLTDAHTLNLLQTCASTGNFYDAKDIGTGLLASFGDISTKVSTEMVRIAK